MADPTFGSLRAARSRIGCLAALTALLAATGAARADSTSVSGGDSDQSSAALGDQSAAPLGESVNVLPQIGNVVPSTIAATTQTSGTSLRDLIAQSAAGASPQESGWHYAPSISVTEEYDDGAANQLGGAGNAFITTVQPSIAVSGDTQRLHVDLNYAPQAILYEGKINGADSSQDRIVQNFDGNMLATLLPSTLFVNLRGFAGEQPRFGGFQPSTAGALYSSDVTQSYSLSASPYLLHRFGGLGSVELGYNISVSSESSDNLPASIDPQAAPQVAALNDIANQDLLSQNLHFAVTTGENFGQYKGDLLASGTKLDGTGVLDHAYRNTITLENDYAVTRSITLLTQVGYEDIHYSGTDPLGIHDPIWDAGFRWTPSRQTSVTVRYGHHDGFNSLSFLASTQPTARTQIYAQYSAGLSAGLEDLQNDLALSDVDAQGNAIDRSSGAPLYVADDFSGTQSGLYRLRRLSIGGSLSYDRDVISLSFDRDDRTLLSSPTPLAQAFGLSSSTRDLSGSISLLHQFSPALDAIASFQYGVIDGEPEFFGFPGTTDTLTAAISLTYAINSTVSLTALYSHSTDSEAIIGFREPDAAQNRVLVGLSKSF